MGNVSGTRKRIAASTRITINAFILALIFGAAITVFAHFYYRNSAEGYYARVAISVADSMASLIDPARFELSLIQTEPDAYWYEVEYLINSIFNRTEGLAYLYIIMPYNNRQFSYYVSASPWDEDWGVYFGMVDAEDAYTQDAWDAMREGSRKTTGIVDAGEWGYLVSAVTPIISANGRVLGLVGADISADQVIASTQRHTLIMAAFVLVGTLILAVILRLRVIGVLSFAFKRIVNAGHLSDVSIDFHAREEDANSRELADRIYYQISEMHNAFKDLSSDISSLVEAHLKGYYNARLDEGKYESGHLTLVKGVNAMVDMYVKDTVEILEVVQAYGKGNFNAELKTKLGDWAWANEAMTNLQHTFVNLAAEMRKLAEGFNSGRFDIAADAAGASGEWRVLIENLNGIAHTVHAPISEIRDVMARFDEGFFDKQIQGDYQGDFAAIKKAVNACVAGIGGYVHEIGRCLTAIANGDLTSRTDMRFNGDFGIIGESINTISSSLHETMSGINAASEQVLMGARQISTSAMDLANGATTQASSIQELNATIEMINRQTQQNADNAHEANALSNKSTQNAQAGNDAMKQLLDAMEKIKESSNNISKIIGTIQDIAFQTNLLALNAAVEAARAGEHGRGFAVVAGEVRTLAVRSQTAATETTDLIADSLKRVEIGNGIAGSTAEALDIIVSNANEVLQIINNISASSKEQADAIGQVVSGIALISQVVQSNSATSEETAASSEQLTSQAELLQKMVSFFRI